MGAQHQATGRTRTQVRRLLREQAGPQWGYVVFLWVFCVGASWVIMRLWGDRVDWFFILGWATTFVAVEGFRQRRRVRQVQHARDVDPVRVTITRLAPRQVVVDGPEGEVRLPVSSTGGLSVGDTVWAAPEPTPGERVVLVRDRLRPGALDLISPRGPAQPG